MTGHWTGTGIGPAAPGPIALTERRIRSLVGPVRCRPWMRPWRTQQTSRQSHTCPTGLHLGVGNGPEVTPLLPARKTTCPRPPSSKMCMGLIGQRMSLRVAWSEVGKRPGCPASKRASQRPTDRAPVPKHPRSSQRRGPGASRRYRHQGLGSQTPQRGSFASMPG